MATCYLHLSGSDEFSGDDIIQFEGVEAGTTVAIGGPGRDQIEVPSNGPSFLVGGSGVDRLEGGLAADLVLGGSGADTIRVHGGVDTVFAGGGDDTVDGTAFGADDGDYVNCSAGYDAAFATRSDRVGVNCEDVTVTGP
jgi:Ca2+-binding RTX toxin-like protein